MNTAPSLEQPLGIEGFRFRDLHDTARLADLTRAFDDALRAADAELFARYEAHRAGSARLKGPEESDLLVAVAARLSAFVGKLFGVEPELAQLREAAGRDAPIFRVKREFVQRRVFRKGRKETPHAGEFPALDAQVAPRLAAARAVDPRFAGADAELALALVLEGLLPAGDEPALDLFDRWLYALTLQDPLQVPAHARGFRDWALLRLPHTLDFTALVPLHHPNAKRPELLSGADEHHRLRDGFGLTDARMAPREVRSEIDYCLYCHEREKDSCSRGFREKPAAGPQPTREVPYRKNPLGIPLTGCPLEERISEMHLVAKEGDPLGALALVTLDNPTCPGTGHRICNDCMKACIYQKQEPVDIPQIETRVLVDVLHLRWGFEIWSLLTRWNPLRLGAGQRQHPRPYAGLNVLVVGLGPAGYTLAHHLANEGFGVVAIDGLKIEPLPPGLVARAPVERLEAVFGKPLDERITSGFGGVSEYGITVRWDKTFLDVLHLNLARRTHVQLYGGIRFGGTVTVEEAFDRYGFSHVALATGAGKPTVIPLRNNLLRGVRKASDFLMALQLTGAFKKESLANLQVRLPALVIGGGLTGIDTATELAAYYPVQVEKLLQRHESLAGEVGSDAVTALLDEEEREGLDELLAHGRAVREERRRAAAAGEKPDFVKLVRAWGGVTLVYRKGLTDSPAYRLNHEEVEKAFEEGIGFAEGLSPVEAVPDGFGALRAVRFARQEEREGKWRDAGEIVELPARTLCVAAGTSPNTTAEKESPGHFELDPEHASFRPYRLVDGQLVPGDVTGDLTGEIGFFTSYRRGDRLVSFFGDNHPVYAGSVVKAMASAKDGYPHLVQLFERELHAASARPAAELQPRWDGLVRTLDDEWRATVHAVQRLTPTIVEVVVRAPAAARRFQPGQFYRLQDFESLAAALGGARLQMEGLALTGAWVDAAAGLLSMIVLEMGASSRLVAGLRPGEPVVVMGPTGAPSTLPRGEDVVLCGGGLGNAVLFSISRALRANGCRVVYFAGYRQAQDVFKRDEIEAATDVVVWAVDRGSNPPAPRRPQDRSFNGNMVEAMVAYATGALGAPAVPFANVRRVLAIGSDRMMAAVAQARHDVLRPYLPADHVGIASINSPMQCMMKEICAQCLCRHRDPVTGKESFVFSCFDQDQEMDRMDWDNLRARLRGNSLQEKLSALWLERALLRGAGPRV